MRRRSARAVAAAAAAAAGSAGGAPPPSLGHSQPEHPEPAPPQPPSSQAEAAGSEDEVEAGLTCSLCHELFVQPATTPCGHSFCALCLAHLFHVRRPGDAPVPPAQRERPCPLCRAPLALHQATPAAELDRAARDAHPALYAQRETEAAVARARLAQRETHYLRLTVGNRHRLVPSAVRLSDEGNRHEWEFFVTLGSPEADARFIQRVVVRLHPTFAPASLELTAPPFTVRRLGWGIFTVVAVVLFKPEWDAPPVPVAWTLQFSRRQRSEEVPLEVSRRDIGDAATPGGGDAGGGDSGDLAQGFVQALGRRVMDWREALAAAGQAASEGGSEEDEDWEPGEDDYPSADEGGEVLMLLAPEGEPESGSEQEGGGAGGGEASD